MGNGTKKRRKGRTAAALVILVLYILPALSGCGDFSDRFEAGEESFPEVSKAEAAAPTEEDADTVRRPGARYLMQEPEASLASESVVEQDEEISSGGEVREYAADVSGGYVYRTLTDEERVVYDEILSCVLNHEPKVSVSTLDKDLLDRCYEAVNADYGGLFWFDGYVYTIYRLGDETTGLEFAPKYTMDYEERLAMQRSIDASVEELLNGVSISDSDYEKAKYVFDTLVDNVDYDLDAPENQNIISTFVYRRTVCQGYACAVQYLLNQLGVESFIVTGVANGENHAWNMVLLDGDYYCLDATWGNSLVSAAEDVRGKFRNYAYLNVTKEELSKTHRSSSPFILPETESMEDNYYIK